MYIKHSKFYQAFISFFIKITVRCFINIHVTNLTTLLFLKRFMLVNLSINKYFYDLVESCELAQRPCKTGTINIIHTFSI